MTAAFSSDAPTPRTFRADADTCMLCCSWVDLRCIYTFLDHAIPIDVRQRAVPLQDIAGHDLPTRLREPSGTRDAGIVGLGHLDDEA